jgi:ferritin-like metal-binding protein YciE
MDMEPEEEECEGIEGLIAEHDEFMEMDPDPAVRDVFHVTAAEKTEHYEIAAYGNLAFLAKQMGMDEVAQLLGQNLDEEEQALETLKALTEGYDYDQVEMAA